VWRQVDRSRTGIPFDEIRPVERYCDFALAAPAMLVPRPDGYRSFAEWLSLANPSLADWHEHLSTLFPEVRPRGHLELRSADVLPPAWFAAPLAFTAGILYAPKALRAADALLGMPDPDLLDRAARHGIHDPLIQGTAVQLFDLALDGCRGLEPAYFHPADLEEATVFAEQYTRRGRAPADDMVEDAVAA
jgi:glutamate--cysteine ligase